MELIFWIFSGVIGGWLAGMAVPARGYGIAGDFLFGLLGGLAGGGLGNLLGLQGGTVFQQIAAAATGGALLVWLVRIIHPGSLRA